MAIIPGTMYDDIGEMALVGGPEDDIIWGGRGDDELSGGGGDDRLIGGPGADVLDGGPGSDTASYARSRGGVHVDLSASFYGPDDENAPVRGADAAGDQLTSIENLWGSMFGDDLTGNHEANVLHGFGGNDELNGNAGADTLRGGEGADVVMGGDGNDMVFGGMGVDNVQGGAGHDMVWGGKGDDTVLNGGAGNDTIEGGEGADSITGGDGDDTVAYTRSPEGVTVDLRPVGSDDNREATDPHTAGGHAEGDDIDDDVEHIIGSMYDDVLHGRNDEDNTIDGAGGNDAIKGWGGEDKLTGGDGMDTLYGGNSDDTLMGGMGDDALKGDAGDDILSGGAGADKIFGGTVNPETMEHMDHGDNDTADYSESDAGVTIDLSKTSRAMPNPIGEGGHAEGDELQGIESLTGSMHDDMLTGTNAANTLKGMDGDDMLTGKDGGDTIDGGKGDDTINGGAGVDKLTGGGGDDTFVYTTINDTRAVDDTSDTRVVNAPAAPTDGSLDLYQVTETRYRAIDLDTGDAAVADGDSMVSGGGGMDTIDASRANADVTVDLNVRLLVSRPMDGTVENADATPPVAEVAAKPLEEVLIYTSIEKVIGGEGDDNLIGNEKASTTLMGGEGNDTLLGGEKDDMLEGGSGNDTVTGGMGNDMLEGGGGDDTLDGGAGADMLMGGSGNDSLVGGTGADTISGGLGSDNLTGDGGADTFVYTGGVVATNGTTTGDTITDFSLSRAGSDKIDLRALDLSEGQLELIVAAANGQDATDGVYLKFTPNDDGSYLGAAGDYDIFLAGLDGSLTANDLAESDFII